MIPDELLKQAREEAVDGNDTSYSRYMLVDVIDELIAARKETKHLTDVLAIAETEMRYAGWGAYDPENVGRKIAHEKAYGILHPGDSIP